MTTLPAVVTIVDLPVGTTITGSELIEAIQTVSGVRQSVQVPISQIATSALGGLPIGGGTSQILGKSSGSNFSTAWYDLTTFVSVISTTGLATSGTGTALVLAVATGGIASTQIANNAVGTNQLASSLGIASSLSVGTLLTVGGTATVTGTTILNGGLQVTGTSLLTGTFGVVGTSLMTGAFNVVGTASFTGVHNVNGTTQFTAGLFGVNATTQFTGTFSVNGTTLHTGIFGVVGTSTLTGTLGVVGTATFTSGAFNVIGTTNITGVVSVVGSASFTGGAFGVTATANVIGIFNVVGTSTFTGVYSVIGTTLFTSGAFGVVATSRFTGAFNVVGTSIITGLLTVSGTSTLSSLATGNLIASGTGVISAPIGQLFGTNTNDNATTGNIGEYIESVVNSGSAISVTSGVTENLTSISLTAGDWDVCGNVVFLPAGTTTTSEYHVGISTASATLQFNASEHALHLAVPAGQSGIITTGTLRISLSITTTIYLAVTQTFAVSTMTIYGNLRARRTR